MHKLLELIRSVLTTGRDPQSFLGAGWIVLLLRLTPSPWKRNVALRILALSPHYFYRQSRPEYKTMPLRAFLEAEYERNRSSRELICRQLLLPYLHSGQRVLDIGCGPGFLARSVSSHTGAVYGCDISPGVLACAQIINPAPNLHYIYSGDSGFEQIEDSSLDLVYSMAVIQHLREDVIRYLFGVVKRKLKPGGMGLLQVQLEDANWKTESDWRQDQSLAGRLKLQYALNCFKRSEDFFRQMAAGTGLTVESIRPISELVKDLPDDVFSQHLLVVRNLGK
jgi:SAM-dependent methyltransferase